MGWDDNMLSTWVEFMNKDIPCLCPADLPLTCSIKLLSVNFAIKYFQNFVSIPWGVFQILQD